MSKQDLLQTQDVTLQNRILSNRKQVEEGYIEH